MKVLSFLDPRARRAMPVMAICAALALLSACSADVGASGDATAGSDEDTAGGGSDAGGGSGDAAGQPDVGVAVDTIGSSDVGGTVDAGSDAGGQDTSDDDTGEDVAQNTAPTVAIDAPADATVVTAGAPVSFSVSVADDESAADALIVTLTSTLDGELGTGNASADGSFGLDVSGLSAGVHQITATVSDPDGAEGQASITLNVNAAPGAPVVAINPDQPTTADALVASIVVPPQDDADGEISYAWSWQVDGVDAGISGPEVPADATAKGQSWTAIATPTDADGAVGVAGSATVTIGNIAPSEPNVVVQPGAVHLASDVTCTVFVEPVDLDNDELTLTFAWTIDGQPATDLDNPGSPSTNVAALVLGDEAVFSPATVPHVGQQLRCVVTVSDGQAEVSATSTPRTLGAFDVCASELNPCSVDAACLAADTLIPTCSCSAGFEGDGIVCTDINECDTGADGCASNATCANTMGAYTCSCNAGYEGDGFACADVNECAVGTDGCDEHATCSNTVGGYECACNNGWDGDGFACADVDECAAGLEACDLNASCTNTAGGYDCACNDGYAGDGFACADVDECALGTDACDVHASCGNTVGGYDCSCNSGYAGDGFACADFDECAAGVDGCDLNAQCSNTVGSYECACNDGFDGDGFACNDIDECAGGGGVFVADFATPAGLDGWTVVNSDAQVGWQLAGGSLIYADPVAGGYSTGGANEGTATTPAFVVPANASLGIELTADVETLGEYDQLELRLLDALGAVEVLATKATLMPQPGEMVALDFDLGPWAGQEVAVQLWFDTVDGIDNSSAGVAVDALGVVADVCDANATCANTFGGYECTCLPGWQGDGATCADVDECAAGLDDCDAHATCGNTPGGFECACDEGWSGDGKSCADVNECAQGLDDCDGNATCKNTAGGFACSCNAGYEGDGNACADIDECAVGADNCHPNATCGNTDGGFGCACNDGFVGDGLDCADVNECDEGLDACDLNASCTNTVGSYGCACDDGFDGDGFACLDIDECALSLDACDLNASCTNTAGSFDCACDAGYAGDGFDCADVDECLPAEPVFGPMPTTSTDLSGWDISNSDPLAGWTYHKGALHYGDPVAGDYAGNGTNSGAALSPVISLPALVTLTFDVTSDTESGSSYDQLSLSVVTPAGTEKVWDNTEIDTDDKVHPVALRLDAYGGQDVQLLWIFDTVDGEENDRSGVYIWSLTVGASACEAGAVCENTVGDFACVCPEGYAPGANGCEDIDECAQLLDNCSANATCSNTAGSFECTCDAGWQGDGVTCTDVDECATGADTCLSFEVCTNLPGLFACTCKDGFVDNGKTCVDINECETGDVACGPAETCVNLAGSAKCVECTLLSEDFDNGLGIAQVDGPLPGGDVMLWDVFAQTGGTDPLVFASPAAGTPNNGELGDEHGALVFPPFDASKDVEISFLSWRNNEEGDSYDSEFFEVSYDGGLSWTVLIDDEAPEWGPLEAWVPVTVALPANPDAALATVRLRYDTGDDCCGPSDQVGWFIDDFAVNLASCSAP